jgi:hypothetical protein
MTSALAGALAIQAGIVTFTDVCFPSIIYNFIFGWKGTKTESAAASVETVQAN